MRTIPISKTTLDRFKTLQAHLRDELGERLTLTHDGKVIVHANHFSSERQFHSLQACIDSYARYLPADFV
jgi:hypothetical protein